MSGSEIAMRIALCDLVERLKRSEQMCKYLEHCRNELAKELIRVRQDNDLLHREYSMLAASIESCEGLHECRNNLINKNESPHAHHPAATSPLNASYVNPPAPDNKVNDENWEEISNRLLKELEKVVVKSKMEKRIASQMEPACQSDDNEEDTTVTLGNSNNSVGSELLIANQPLPENSGSRNRVHWQEDNDEDDQETTKTTKTAGGSGESRLKSQDVEVLYTLIKSFTEDINMVTNSICSSNEKLSKLKTRQLRNFFRRQLVEDASKGSRCHLEHV